MTTREPPHCSTCCCGTDEGDEIARLHAEVERLNARLAHQCGVVEVYEAQQAARDRVIEAAFRALDYCSSVLTRRNDGSTHWDACEEFHPDCRAINAINKARRLRAEPEEGK